MTKHLDRELDTLRSDLISQFGLVEHMILTAVRALAERRGDLAQEVIDQDAIVDANDIKFEEECLKLLALHQPVASSMRWLFTVVKVNNELERMADLACNIAERAKSIEQYPLFSVPEELDAMAAGATQMVKTALDSFIEGDVEKSREVIAADDKVDRTNRLVIDLLHDVMRENPDYIAPAVHCFSASRHLERIADLAVNISEEVIYLVLGDIVRHQHGETGTDNGV
ncbi:phosphate signaling complex protein PhoU [Rubripirellula sp.]|nr:phosphate signaling complex protein PhoU [Rubripirellula sp.]MDA7874339.1 phosphate signaling complex protein PhoU [Rhodopirellula sp.]MDA7915161.1 phosphate signaling complex protein PhoU [bacterium]MDB4393716.1 phosphate signaling complex protein PhoU [Rhodopirellula sp.]MDB4474940.1 phosphate signaling complex protein PhoU [bacterium]MDB4477282.1 phosphate signaling complex protein PhoU [Rhodopirellula sp.]